MLRLSEAIRIGSVMKPQGFGYGRDVKTTACALDAAAIAIGMGDSHFCSPGDRERCDKFWETFPIMREEVACPVCGEEDFSPYLKLKLSGVIATHLNDRHRWDRDRIANWVQQFEDAHAPTTDPVVTTASEPVAVG